MKDAVRRALHRLVDTDEINRAIMPLWAQSFRGLDNTITVEWMEQVIAERKRHNETVVPPNNDAVFVEGGK
jgi:hypothetical protein